MGCLVARTARAATWLRAVEDAIPGTTDAGELAEAAAALVDIVTEAARLRARMLARAPNKTRAIAMMPPIVYTPPLRRQPDPGLEIAIPLSASPRRPRR